MDNLLKSDLDYLRFIHKLYYDPKFPFPNFESFQYASKIINGDQIITAGGVKLIPELICITNKALSPRIRREALLLILEEAKDYCRRNNFDQLTTFIQNDERWVKQIKRYGFEDINGVGLISGV